MAEAAARVTVKQIGDRWLSGRGFFGLKKFVFKQGSIRSGWIRSFGIKKKTCTW